MYWMPNSKALLKLWALNFKTNIGAIATRIKQPPADVTKVEVDLDKLIAALNNAEVAKLEYERLAAIAKTIIDEVSATARLFVKQLKVNPLFTATDAEALQVVTTSAIADVTDYTPELTVKESGGTLHVGFKKHGADGMNVYSRMQGQASFQLAFTAKHSPFIFTPAPLAEGASQVYEFCATPTLANIEVGHRSVIVSFKFSR